jgi:hypothetical protein
VRRALTVVVCIAFAGCGFGEGEERDGGADLRVTRDFGHEQLAARAVDTIREDETVMRLLQSHHDVETRFGGNFVDEIDGLRGAGSRDWIYYVNGIWADHGAAERELEPGDVVQWDNHDWSAAQRIPAIVGAYPEPFRSGSGGERLPTRLECADTESQVCGDVKEELNRAGARVSTTQVGASAGGDELLRVLVGRWEEIREIRTPATLEDGPGSSGVFARFTDDGTTLELLDEDGDAAQAAPVGTGLVAATALEEQAVVWLVTGLDDAGVQAASALLDERVLRNAFAVAATPDGPVKLPLEEGDG